MNTSLCQALSFIVPYQPQNDCIVADHKEVIYQDWYHMNRLGQGNRMKYMLSIVTVSTVVRFLGCIFPKTSNTLYCY